MKSPLPDPGNKVERNRKSPNHAPKFHSFPHISVKVTGSYISNPWIQTDQTKQQSLSCSLHLPMVVFASSGALSGCFTLPPIFCPSWLPAWSGDQWGQTHSPTFILEIFILFPSPSLYVWNLNNFEPCANSKIHSLCFYSQAPTSPLLRRAISHADPCPAEFMAAILS